MNIRMPDPPQSVHDLHMCGLSKYQSFNSSGPLP